MNGATRARLAAFGCILASGLAVLSGPVSADTSDHRGGTMRLVARSAAGTLDPQVNYTLQYWQIYQPLYDGLLAFKKVAGPDSFTVVPDIAEALPKPEDGGALL